MAATIANLSRYVGGRDVFGGHGVIWLNYTGPNPYAPGATGGDEVDALGFGPNGSSQCGLRTIDSIITQMSADALYSIEARPFGLGPNRRFFLHWFVVATGLEAGAINLSGSQSIVGIVGG
jgi:hypothetical protein